MKYCLKYLKNKYIQEADEIQFAGLSDDMIDMLERFPSADFISEINEEVDWDFAKMLSQKMKEQGRRFMISTFHTDIALEAKKREIEFFFSYALTSFADLQAVVELGACQALITAPIFFEQKKVAKFGIPLRYRANVAYNGYFTAVRQNANAAYIRPEDQELYPDATIEFGSVSVGQEETLYKIYKYDKKWSGDLNILIKNLNYSPAPMNRMISENFGEGRLDCGGRCTERTPAYCHFCTNTLRLANPELIKSYVDEVVLPPRSEDRS